MVIYLQHPRHGTKVACSEEEARADEKVGWERYTLEERDNLIERYQERFGKKPHHKKSIETLKAELA